MTNANPKSSPFEKEPKPQDKPKFDFDVILQKYNSFARNLDSPSKLIEYTMDEYLPAHLKEKYDTFLENTKISVDFIFRHLL